MSCPFCQAARTTCNQDICVIYAEFEHRPTVIQRICSVFQYRWITRNVDDQLRKGTLDRWIYYRLRDCNFLHSNPIGGAIQRLEELERQLYSIGGRNLKRKMLDEAKQQLLHEARQEFGGRNMKRKILDEARQQLINEARQQLMHEKKRHRQRMRRRNAENVADDDREFADVSGSGPAIPADTAIGDGDVARQAQHPQVSDDDREFADVSGSGPAIPADTAIGDGDVARQAQHPRVSGDDREFADVSGGGPSIPADTTIGDGDIARQAQHPRVSDDDREFADVSGSGPAFPADTAIGDGDVARQAQHPQDAADDVLHDRHFDNDVDGRSPAGGRGPAIPTNADGGVGCQAQYPQPAKRSKRKRRTRFEGQKCNPLCICTSPGCPCPNSQ